MSGSETATIRTGRLRRSPARIASAVFSPWPISTALVSTSRLPSSLSLAEAVDVEGVTVPLMMQDRPLARTLLPRRSGSASQPRKSQPILLETLSSSSWKCESVIGSPVMTVSPSFRKLRMRSS